jgi:mannosyl-3-phosphoglycerate phosphatase family protein
VSAGDGVRYLVFTDLDGSLLDHHNYSYQDAMPQLRQLDQLDIPVIPASSKTRVEIERLRAELGNEHPFIAENGAATYIPVGYFPSQPRDTVLRDDYWIHELSPPRATWLDALAKLESDFPGSFDYFHRAGTEGIMRMTNLPRERAEEANQREYSEPVKWFGDEQERETFLARLAEAGALVLQGGRFLSVCGDCDKGRALAWLRDSYRQAWPLAECHDIAIGDSGNDCAMLEAAETALLIRSTVHEFPALQRTEGVLHSEDYGPAGWAEGVARWLHLHRIENRDNRG